MTGRRGVFSPSGRQTPGRSSTAADHIEATRLSLAQLPARLRGRVLVRAELQGRQSTTVSTVRR
jgi:hypothetical protein